MAETKMTLNCECRLCGSKKIILVNEQDYYNWRQGAYIQNAMPYLTVGQRELLISQTCETCFDRIFGEA